MKLRNFAIAAGVAALTLTGIAPAGANENNTNNPDNWVGAAAAAAGVDPEMISCYNDSFGSIVEGGTAVELDPYTGDGSGYALLVVKGGAVDYGWGDGNAEPVEYPVAGTPYFTPLNGGGQQAGVSHWIVCVDDTVPTPPVGEPPTPPVPPQPDDKIVYGEYAEGEWVCGDTTVTLTRGFTVTPYVWNGEEWVLDTANATSGVEAKLRDLTEEELASCVEEPPTPPTPPAPPVDPSIEDAEVIPMCGAEGPYLAYTVTVNDPAGTLGDTATLTFHHPTDAAQDWSIEVGLGSGTVIWPGVEWNTDGTVATWPGWYWDVDAEEWVEDASANYGWTTAPDTEVSVTVDPLSQTLTVTYPGGVVGCDFTPTIVVVDDIVAETPTTSTEAPTTTVAPTKAAAATPVKSAATYAG
ncbi:hypothetical protein [Demequina lignilytica]|uniref:Uncharacterized protein n=1 Tax=Demequina lignilytica TaxID=3051663 RepID=A0AB35MK65_9MICO|nr:hypothetical protein [Demequina sp. SYSU T0a273]MDN4484153.1 hypothetical protein [Demequina sp. SYSU T0a273]